MIKREKKQQPDSKILIRRNSKEWGEKPSAVNGTNFPLSCDHSVPKGSDNPTLYVITHHRHNHEKKGCRSLDQRFLQSHKNIVFYLIDEHCPLGLKNEKVLFEKTIDPLIHKAGKQHFAEWSFLLNEAKHGFCDYPLFMISSRFYQKNDTLFTDLDQQWDMLFSYLQRYGWGFLPSYDRPLRFLDMSYKKKVKDSYGKTRFFPFHTKAFEWVQDIYKLSIPDQYSARPDINCNYLGFASREHLLQYVTFYAPLIEAFFDHQFEPKVDLFQFVKPTKQYPKERIFAFLLEHFSHLFFYKKRALFFTLHYNGYYEIDVYKRSSEKILSFSIPWKTQMKRALTWQLRRLKTETVLAQGLNWIKELLGLSR